MKNLFEISGTPFAVHIGPNGNEAELYVCRRCAVETIQEIFMISEIFIGFVQNRLVVGKNYEVEKMIFSFRINEKTKVIYLEMSAFNETYSFDKLESNYIAASLKKLLSEVKFSKFSKYIQIIEEENTEEYGSYFSSRIW